MEILHCLEKEKPHELATRDDVDLFTTTVLLARDDFVSWHPSDRHEEADKILAVAAKMCLASNTRQKLCRLSVQSDTTTQLLDTIQKYFPSPEASEESSCTV